MEFQPQLVGKGAYAKVVCPFGDALTEQAETHISADTVLTDVDAIAMVAKFLT